PPPPPPPAPAPLPPAPAPSPTPPNMVPAPSFSPLLRARVNPGTWGVIGSSTAAGVGATPGNGWAARIGSAYAGKGVGILNLGLGGSVTYNGLSAEVPPTQDRPPPDGAHNVDAAL